MRESRGTSSFTIGLTGGIGSGKTTVSKLFNELGAAIIDADEISRALVSNESPLLEKILGYFGQQVANADGGLDRKALRELVFHDPAARTWLESLLHPAIREEILRQLSASNAPYVIVVVPLLVESGSYDFLDRVLVVDAPESEQLARLRRRDGSSTELAERMLAAQAGRQQRLEKANDVIDNSGSLDALDAQVRELHARYLQLAAN